MRVVLGSSKNVLVNQTGVNLQRLSDLNDVDVSGVKDGDIMIYDGDTNTYRFGDVLDDLEVKNFTANGDILITGNVDIGGTVSFDDFQANTATILDSLTVNDLTVQGTFETDDITSENVTVIGNLSVVGQITSILSDELEISDNIIVLNSSLDDFTAPTADGGIRINRGSEADVSLFWDETNDYWSVGNLSFAAQTFVGNLQGNADTATALATEIDITLTDDVTGSASFDGTGNITIETTVEFVDGGYY